jgi:hypothetical protein
LKGKNYQKINIEFYGFGRFLWVFIGLVGFYRFDGFLRVR